MIVIRPTVFAAKRVGRAPLATSHTSCSPRSKSSLSVVDCGNTRPQYSRPSGENLVAIWKCKIQPSPADGVQTDLPDETAKTWAPTASHRPHGENAGE